MTDTLENQAVIQPERYRYAKAAGMFIQGKDIVSARKSLDKLLEDMSLPDDVKEGMVWNASDDPKAVAKGAEIYMNKYDNALGNKTMKEMYERYMPEFNKYLTEKQREKAKTIFEALGDKKYEDFADKAKQLKNQAEDDTKKYTDEEKEKAKKEYNEKYAPILSTIQEFEELRISPLVFPIRESTIKDSVRERFKAEEAQAA